MKFPIAASCRVLHPERNKMRANLIQNNLTPTFVNEEHIQKIDSSGHWGKPLVCKEKMEIETGFELGVAEYYCEEYPFPKIHPDEEAIYILSGEGYAKVGETEIPLKKGTAFYVPPNIPHCIRRIGPGPLKSVYCHSGTPPLK